MINKKHTYKFLMAAGMLLLSCGRQSMEAEKAIAVQDSIAYPQENMDLGFSSDSLTTEQKELFGKRAIQKLEDYYDCLEIIWNKQYDSTLRKQAKSVAEELFYNKNDIHTILDSDYKNSDGGKIIALNFFIVAPPIMVNDSTYLGRIQHEVGFYSQAKPQVGFSIRKVRKNFGNEQRSVWESYLEQDERKPSVLNIYTFALKSQHMKKLTLFLLSVTAILAFSFTGSEFEGKIVYSISVEGDNLPPTAKAMFESSEVNVYIKGTHSCTNVDMGMQSTSTITDRKANTSVMLMEMMGEKYKITSNPKDNNVSETSVKYGTETKEIAGYKCKKAEITYKDKSGNSHTTNIWYTEQINNYLGFDNRNTQFKDLKGMPLEYEVSTEQGMKMKMTAKTISKESVPDSKFVIPADYKETTMEDLQKEMMQKMMQGGGQH